LIVLESWVIRRRGRGDEKVLLWQRGRAVSVDIDKKGLVAGIAISRIIE
jgi:hypothetical protein